MSTIWPATVTLAQYEFLRTNISGFPEGESERHYMRVGFTLENLRHILNEIDKMGESPRDDVSQGDIAEMYMNVSVAFERYEDFHGLK